MNTNFPLKQYLTKISPVIPSVETFLPVIIVVILWIQTIEQNIAVKAELIDPHGLSKDSDPFVCFDPVRLFTQFLVILDEFLEVEPVLRNGKRIGRYL